MQYTLKPPGGTTELHISTGQNYINRSEDGCENEKTDVLNPVGYRE